MVQQKHVWGIYGKKAKGTESLKKIFWKKFLSRRFQELATFLVFFVARECVGVWVVDTGQTHLVSQAPLETNEKRFFGWKGEGEEGRLKRFLLFSKGVKLFAFPPHIC